MSILETWGALAHLKPRGCMSRKWVEEQTRNGSAKPQPLQRKGAPENIVPRRSPWALSSRRPGGGVEDPFPSLAGH